MIMMHYYYMLLNNHLINMSITYVLFIIFYQLPYISTDISIHSNHYVISIYPILELFIITIFLDLYFNYL